ncbi:MAG: response regulator transcription factor [Gammaproteobacteria bacterium]|nr:response regulator transcription factor [Gammaproteobacteria bacterium]
MSNLKILLVDDHEVVRAGFKSLLLSNGRYDVIEAGSAETGYKVYLEQSPDLIVCDINMPGMGGVELVRRIKAQDVQVKVIVLSMYDDISHVENMKKLSVNGYVTKRSAPTELLEAIEAVSLNHFYLSDDLVDKGADTGSRPSEINELSKREFEIFVLLAQGSTVTEVASNLNISPKTASNHRDNIMHKLDVKNLVELSRYAIRHGIVTA